MAMNFKSHRLSLNLFKIFFYCLLLNITTQQSPSGDQNSLDQELSYPNSPIFSEEGDDCNTKSGTPGKCTVTSQCEHLSELIKANEPPITCSFGVFEEIICCPSATTQADIEENFNTLFRKNILTSIKYTSTTIRNRPMKIGDATMDKAALLIQLSELFRPQKPQRNLHAISKSGSIGNKNPFLHVPNQQTKDTTNPWLTTVKSTTERTTFTRDKGTQTSRENQQQNMKRDNPIHYPRESDEDEPYIISKNPLPTRRTTTKSPVTVRSRHRAAVRACTEIDNGLSPLLTPHIIGGTPVALGEYPHMAALGFQSIGGGDYEFRCGGTLIAPRFVLTAAHCVIRQDSSPSIVRLGFVNLKDEQQLQEAVDMPVQSVHIHPDYSTGRAYNDIAILELERNVTYSSRIYPTCLYTEPGDPPPQAVLFVTGWGVMNTATRSVSNILLKARLSTISLAKCNATYLEQGSRQLPRGLDRTQMCAYDPDGKRDACQGDSGGPINLVEDESLQKYRVVGITSAGFSCGTLAPSLYTRVSAYLDFIESIVWPNSAPN